MALLFISGLVLAVDQLLKSKISSLLFPGESYPVIKKFLYITVVHNKGAAFGLFKRGTNAFVFITTAAILFIVYYLPRLKKEAIFGRLGLAFILGGAVSNLIDRVRLGYVVDYLDLRFWPVFNIADAAITVGAVLFTIELLRNK